MTFYLVFWGVVFGMTVIAEIATMQLVSIWFACGALGAFGGALGGLGFTGQLAIFVLISLLLLIVTRPILRKLRVKEIIPMNASRDIGASAVVIEEINPALGTGRARVNGVDWIAISGAGAVIPKDAIVTIAQIDGAKLIVYAEASAPAEIAN